MPDNRPRVTTAKTLDLAALDASLGGHGLCGGEGEVVVAEGSPVTQKQLEDAVTAAPEYVEPDPEPTAQDVIAAIQELAAEGAEVEQRISDRAAQKAQERAAARTG